MPLVRKPSTFLQKKKNEGGNKELYIFFKERKGLAVINDAFGRLEMMNGDFPKSLRGF